MNAFSLQCYEMQQERDILIAVQEHALSDTMYLCRQEKDFVNKQLRRINLNISISTMSLRCWKLLLFENAQYSRDQTIHSRFWCKSFHKFKSAFLLEQISTNITQFGDPRLLHQRYIENLPITRFVDNQKEFTILGIFP